MYVIKYSNLNRFWLDLACCSHVTKVYLTSVRTSQWKCSIEIGVPKNFANFRKTPALESVFNKAAGF